MSVYEKLISIYSKSLILSILPTFNVNQTLNNGPLSIQKEKETKIFEIGEELFLLRTLFTTSVTLRSYFANPIYEEENKLKLLCTIFPELSTSTKAFLKILATRKHLFLIPLIFTKFNEYLLIIKNQSTVKMVVASPLKKQFGEKILQILKGLTHSSQIHFELNYNPNLLGGFYLEYNSFLLDTTLVKDFRNFLN